jgi:hypothetical protein
MEIIAIHHAQINVEGINVTSSLVTVWDVYRGTKVVGAMVVSQIL